MSVTDRPSRRPRVASRIAAALATVAVVVAGVWVTGGVLSDDFRTSMALTTVWLLAAGAAAAVFAFVRRGIGVPVLVAYVVSAGLLGAWLGYTTLVGETVDEEVVAGVPASTAPVLPAETAEEAPPPAVDVQVAGGTFTALEHETAGRAALVELARGGRVLTLTGFETDPGPDLRVRLVPGSSSDGGAEGAVDLGALKGTRGDQQYRVPRRAPADATVVIWCRAFSAAFGRATLSAS